MALLRIALDEQDLGAAGSAQQDERGCRARLDRVAEVELLARWRTVRAHPRSLPRAAARLSRR